ncbi:hypothetical protein TNCV_3972741 [Trichonephila clavipes]|nr:hypothetical protein TNCV_3972741 [Trichonephila clavipes]
MSSCRSLPQINLGVQGGIQGILTNGIEEVVDLGRQINLEMDGNSVQEQLDSYHQEPTMDELIELREQDIEEL